MKTFLLFTMTLVLLAGCASSNSGEGDTAGVTAAVEGFYGAMKKADPQAAMGFIAEDAYFLEGGNLETRQQYEENHLPADIDFEKQVNGQRSPWDIKFDGNTAWVQAMTEYHGEFEGAPVDFVSAQLLVLTKGEQGWKIRAAHWSSHRL